MESKPRILLFGRTGSGKSTVANMLARGHLGAPLLFRTSSSVRGETLRMQEEEGEAMVIVDTVGLGESQQGSVSNKEAQGILYNFFTRMDQGFHYFAFVRKWGRNDFLDEQLWTFFRQAFKGAEANFLVIFTHFDKAETELEVPDTKDLLLKMYHPCERWICVDFPDPAKKLTILLTKVTDRRRARSAARLTENLSAFLNPPLAPDVCRQLRVGRVLLLGRRATAKAILGNLLVMGNFLQTPSHDLPFSVLPSSNQAFSFASMDQPFKEAKGRRWEVVDLHAFDSYIVQKDVDDRQLALTLTESIVTTLMHAEGFSHVVYVHESGQSRHSKDEMIDKLFWQIILALLSTAIRDERLVLVIASNGLHRPSPSSGKAMLAENARFKECKNLLHLDIPSIHDDGNDDVVAEQPMATKCERLDTTQRTATRGERFDTSQRIFEQVLQKEVDTQSTFFKLKKLSRTEQHRLIAEVAETFLTPVVKAMNKKPNRAIFKVLRSRTLSELSSAYKKIVNKKRSGITVKVQQKWEEQKNKEEQGQEDIWEEEEEEEEELEQLAAASSDDGGFCESRQLVVGQHLDFCYVQMKCNSSQVVKCIEVAVQSHDQGWSQYRNDHGTDRNTWTWGELAVLAPNGHNQIGERIRVYTNLHAVDEWQFHFKTVTDPSFLESIQAHHFIALYLRSCFAGWCNYTRYASLKLVHAESICQPAAKPDALPGAGETPQPGIQCLLSGTS